MANTQLAGWLDDDFLTTDFGEGLAGEYTGMQLQMVIASSKPMGAQVGQIIDVTYQNNGAQVEMDIVDAGKALGVQVHAAILDYINNLGAQCELQKIDTLKTFGMQIASSNILFHVCGGFLTDNWLTGDFLKGNLCAHAGAQVAMFTSDTKEMGAQVELDIVDKLRNTGAQIEMDIIDYLGPNGMQIVAFTAYSLGAQIRFILYNTNRPRILAEFPSRGTSGINWTASSTEAGDFSANNLNNDIVDFYWRTATGVVSGITVACDTEIVQGVAPDTLAILEHNFSKAATVLFQGSNTADFSVIGLSVAMTAQVRNTFWVSPSLPLNQYRYWRLNISDNTNPDGYIKIGTVVFGAAIIFQGECAEQHVRTKKTHFKVENATEGHTSVTQDLALRKGLTINFPQLDAQHRGNYDALQELFEFARTSLKCLWMVDPRPLYIEKFSVFAKMTQMPDEDHNVITSDEFRVDLTVDVDEAK